MKMTKSPSDAGENNYQPSPQEQRALRKYADRKARDSAPGLKITDDGGKLGIAPDHPHIGVGTLLLMEAVGTADEVFLNGLIHQMANAGSHGPKIDERGLNFMLSVVKGIQPRDQIEAMLASQMAAVHMACMKVARKLEHVETLAQQDSAERAFNKLARTFAGQMEALKRYRTGGEQKVTVQHVSVQEGGQAIVGNVTQSAPREARPEELAASRPALTDARTAPMPIINESKERVRIPAQRKSRK